MLDRGHGLFASGRPDQVPRCPGGGARPSEAMARPAARRVDVQLEFGGAACGGGAAEVEGAR